MIEQSVERIGERFALTKLDTGEFASFRAAPLKLRSEQYSAEGLGNVSLLYGSAMAGLMRMETLVIDPFERDLPLFSFDRISALGNETMILEYYDTLLRPNAFNIAALLRVKESVAQLREHDLGEHWYDYMKLPASFAKKTGRSALSRLETAFVEALDAYLAAAAQSTLLSETEQTEKHKKASAYVNGLLQNGGPSTDAFVKSIGADKTRKLFRGIVFGTQE